MISTRQKLGEDQRMLTALVASPATCSSRIHCGVSAAVAIDSLARQMARQNNQAQVSINDRYNARKEAERVAREAKPVAAKRTCPCPSCEDERVRAAA